MTWLGDQSDTLGDKKRAALLKKRDALVAEIETLKKRGPTGKYPHQLRHHQEDLIALAKKVTKIDEQLGRPVDRFSGE